MIPIRLVLVSSPVSLQERYGLFSGAASTEPSFGLVSLAAVALRIGAKVRIVEAASENLTIHETFKEVLDFKPDVVGISSTTAGIIPAGGLARMIKVARPGIATLIGGCHVSALPEETLLAFKGFDLAVMGEGEETLNAILKAVQKRGECPRDLPGTAVREGEGVRINPTRALIPDLDVLPLPAWSLLRGFPRKFRPSPGRVKRWPCASIVLTRGCPNQCRFCDRSVFGNQCRAYSPGYAVRMLKDLRENYGVKEILIEDDTFVISRQRVQEFCERIRAEKLDITWSCLGRADRVSPDLLRLMREAGCWHISYGIESGDPEILRSMKKNLNLKQIERAVWWSRDAGLRTKGFFMVGFPGESKRSLSATRSLANSLPLDDITIMQLTPFPGSALYEVAEHYGEFERDWRRMNTLDTVFVPHGFSKRGLESVRAEILRDFYLRPRIIIPQMMRVAMNPLLALGMFRGFLSFLKVIRTADPHDRGEVGRRSEQNDSSTFG
jgi:anaerobic magnesium-protoporphyrin IX monomethyl ester cyclase